MGIYLAEGLAEGIRSITSVRCRAYLKDKDTGSRHNIRVSESPRSAVYSVSGPVAGLE